MKKLFKGIAILAATAAVGTGAAFVAGCGGTDGEYIGHYAYANEHNAAYGIVVKVTVKNNIIEKVEDVTHTYGDGKAFSITFNEVLIENWAPVRDEHGNWKRTDTVQTVYNADWHTVSAPGYGWSEESYEDWLNKESWLLQQYEGKSVAEVLAIKVFYDENGEPYSTKDNAEFATSGLVMTGATQGSGRLLKAVQNALSK
ncbi:MAG: hypothetical protein K2N23_02385 [Clostridia bacterium]|nr:hypothetical protein [Clostridia bacterium]